MFCILSSGKKLSNQILYFLVRSYRIKYSVLISSYWIKYSIFGKYMELFNQIFYSGKQLLNHISYSSKKLLTPERGRQTVGRTKCT